MWDYQNNLEMPGVLYVYSFEMTRSDDCEQGKSCRTPCRVWSGNKARGCCLNPHNPTELAACPSAVRQLASHRAGCRQMDNQTFVVYSWEGRTLYCWLWNRNSGLSSPSKAWLKMWRQSPTFWKHHWGNQQEQFTPPVGSHNLTSFLLFRLTHNIYFSLCEDTFLF